MEKHHEKSIKCWLTMFSKLYTTLVKIRDLCGKELTLHQITKCLTCPNHKGLSRHTISKLVKMIKLGFKSVERIAGKGENTGNQHRL